VGYLKRATAELVFAVVFIAVARFYFSVGETGTAISNTLAAHGMFIRGCVEGIKTTGLTLIVELKGRFS
jgi:hypothetical protein